MASYANGFDFDLPMHPSPLPRPYPRPRPPGPGQGKPETKQRNARKTAARKLAWQARMREQAQAEDEAECKVIHKQENGDAEINESVGREDDEDDVLIKVGKDTEAQAVQGAVEQSGVQMEKEQQTNEMDACPESEPTPWMTEGEYEDWTVNKSNSNSNSSRTGRRRKQKEDKQHREMRIWKGEMMRLGKEMTAMGKDVMAKGNELLAKGEGMLQAARNMPSLGQWSGGQWQ